MKTMFGNLVLLCLLAHVFSDCQRDCLTCNKHIYQGDGYNTLLCIVECEGKAYPSGIWEVCKKALGMVALPLSADSMEEGAYQPLAMRDSLFSSSLKHLDDLTKVIGLSKIEGEKRVSKISGVIHERGEEDGGIESHEAPLGLTSEADGFGDTEGQPKDIAKRYGGFLKGKYSYRKFMEPARGMQKRYGGFIGVRKSARKWNNQKRFSQFLKQYLGMSTRSSEYDSLSTDLNEQNEI
ncbi:prepronociceptin [Ambystoma mexicanum]|uniref:prepronociceptin n=1 Tax=Ambystoma mexicanum TaxID=8296 RepID=UPI0037E7F098